MSLSRFLKTIFIDTFSVFNSYGECGWNHCVGIKLLNKEAKVFQNPNENKEDDGFICCFCFWWILIQEKLVAFHLEMIKKKKIPSTTGQVILNILPTLPLQLRHRILCPARASRSMGYLSQLLVALAVAMGPHSRSCKGDWAIARKCTGSRAVLKDPSRSNHRLSIYLKSWKHTGEGGRQKNRSLLISSTSLRSQRRHIQLLHSVHTTLTVHGTERVTFFWFSSTSLISKQSKSSLKYSLYLKYSLLK